MAAPKHPHEDRPSDERLAELLAGRPAALVEAYLGLHRIVRAEAPAVDWSTDLVDGASGYGIGQFGYGGWGMAALMAHGKWVSLAFMRGADLTDPTGIMEGSGKAVRHLKVRSMAELEERAEAIGALVLQAVRLNAG